MLFTSNFDGPFEAYLEKYPEGEFRTLSHLIKSCRAYVETYDKQEPLQPDFYFDEDKKEKRAKVEQTFAFPYWQNQHFVIMLSGTIDFNGTYAGERCLVDHKTTAARDEMFFYRFNFDIQPMFYVWVDNYLNMRGDVYLPFLVNGIFLKKPSVKAMNEDRWDGCEFRRSSLIHYSINQMHEFSSWLENKLNKLCSFLDCGAFKEMEKNLELSACKEIYGSLCKYFPICSLSPERRAMKVEASFTDGVTYEPLRFQK